MNNSISQPSLPTPILLSDKGARMAKADVRKADNALIHAQLGHCMQEVQHAFCLTLKEFAAELGKDERQVQRQMDGIDRPQIEAVFAVERFQGPMVIAMARVAAGVEVDTVVHIRGKRKA